MKKLILLLILITSMSGCTVLPTRLSTHEKKLWIHQNYPKKYYYKRYPNRREKIRRGRTYLPYFKNGRY